MIYNVVFMDGKICSSYLNISKQCFFNKLWEWCYEDNLWDIIDDDYLTEEEKESCVLQFIQDNIFHKDEDDDVNCFAFVNTIDGIMEYYYYDEDLTDFIKSKIKEHYD